MFYSKQINYVQYYILFGVFFTPYCIIKFEIAFSRAVKQIAIHFISRRVIFISGIIFQINGE